MPLAWKVDRGLDFLFGGGNRLSISIDSPIFKFLISSMTSQLPLTHHSWSVCSSFLLFLVSVGANAGSYFAFYCWSCLAIYSSMQLSPSYSWAQLSTYLVSLFIGLYYVSKALALAPIFGEGSSFGYYKILFSMNFWVAIFSKSD